MRTEGDAASSEALIGIEGAAAQSVDSENGEVVFGDIEGGGELRIDGAGGQQSQSSQQRASGRIALAERPRLREGQPVIAVGRSRR